MKNSVEASVSSNGTASQGSKGQEIEDGTNGTASGDSDDEKLVIDLDASGSSLGASGSLKNFPEKVKVKEEKLEDSSSVESDNGLKMKIKRTKQTANNKTETKHEIVKDSKVTKLQRNAAIQSTGGKNSPQTRKSMRKMNNSSSNPSVAAKNNSEEAAEKINASSCSSSSVPNQKTSGSVKSSQKVAAEAIKGPKMPSTGSTKKEGDTPTEGVGPGPCEANTKVRLEGIVWQESVAAGLLVVNVTWRGRTYVGTLLDATRHSWAPPRCSDSPTSELEPRTPRGRGRRSRLGTGTLSLECLEQRKLRNKNRRSVTTPSSAGSGGRTPGAESPKLPEGGAGASRRRARPPDLDLDEVLRAKRARGASSAASTPVNTPMEDTQARASPAPSSDTPPPRSIDCTEENCSDKFDNRDTLALHRKEIPGIQSAPVASPTPTKAKKGSRKGRNKKVESMEVEEGETEKPMEVEKEEGKSGEAEAEKASRLSPESSVSAPTIEKTAASSAIANFTSTCTVSKSVCHSYPASSAAIANTNTTINANNTVQSSVESATTTRASDASQQSNRASSKNSFETSIAPSLNLLQSTATTRTTSTKPNATATAPSKKVTAVTATIKPATSCEQQQASSTPTKEKEKKPSRKRKPKETPAATATAPTAPTEVPAASNPAAAHVPAVEPSATVAPSPKTSGEQLVPTQHSPQMLMARAGPREVHAFLQGGTISIGPDPGLQSMGEENLGSPAAYSDISDAEDDHQSERPTVAAPRKNKAPVSTPAPPSGGRDVPTPHSAAEQQHALSAMYSNMYSLNQYYNNLQHLAAGSAGRGVVVSEASATKPELKPSQPQQQQENRPSVSANVQRRSDQDVRELAHNYANGKGGDPAEHRRLLESNTAYGHYYKFYMDEKQQVEREKMRQQTADSKTVSGPPLSSMSPVPGKVPDRKGKMLPSVAPLGGKPMAGVRPLQQASVAPQVRASPAGKPVASAAPMPHQRPDSPGKKRDRESPVKVDPAGVSHYLDPAAVAYPTFSNTAALDPLRMAAQLSQLKYASAFMQGFPGPASGLGDRPPTGAGTDRRDKSGSVPSPAKPRNSASPALKPAPSPSTKPLGLASGAAPPGVTDAKAEEGRDGSPRPQRHLHTHHHTHVVQPGYPLIPGTMPAGTYAALAAAAAAQSYMPPPNNK